MAEAQGANQPQAGERVIVREVEVRPATPPQPTKEFRLRRGASHHVGDAVNGLTRLTGIDGPNSPRVRLTRDQARAFADKFEAVDDSDFEVVKSEDAQRREAPKNVDPAAETEGGPQGKPLVGPPEVVRGATVSGAPAMPADPTTLDPARQGQPTSEQERVFRAGQASTPTFKVDPKDTPDVPQQAGTPAQPTGVVAGAGTGSTGAPSKAEVKQTGEVAKK